MEPNLCANGCGFYGSAENRNMCSKCYNDFLKSKLIAAVDPKKDVSVVSEITTKLEDLTVKEKVNRCMCCKKKVGLFGFRCRCDGLFCGRHRFPELHSCQVDCKASDHRSVAKNPHLTLVIADKLKSRI